MQELLAGEYGDRDLSALLTRASEISKAVENYRAAAVLDARSRGASWEQVARSAHISTHTARERWNEMETERRLARQLSALALQPDSHSPHLPKDRRLTSGECLKADRAARLLAEALRFLHDESKLPLREVAASMGVSPSYASRILSAERLPSWSAVQDMMKCFGADAVILRHLWETSHGLLPPARRPLAQAADRVIHCLQGLYTAAHRPNLVDLHHQWPGVPTPAEVDLVLHGVCMPDWPVVSSLVTALNGSPEEVRPLWEEFHYAWLCTFNQGGNGRVHPRDADGQTHPS
ncbi:transcriptional regulator [Streptomyces noursei]|uniref:transcriptional regulator n=1 Tax=Streptomyces noursei TaxID=1971 RepID=UPI0005C861CA|nr:helix-turn-helix transcriptional regulator [Streptomyces noursei]